MTLFPDQPDQLPDAIRDDILKSCEVLRRFLKGDILPEVQETYIEVKNLTEDLEQRVGTPIDPLIDAHIPRFNRTNLFNTNGNLDILRNKISISILIGYELADVNQAGLFIVEIMNKLQVKSADNTTAEEVLDIIEAGSIYRKYLVSPEGDRIAHIPLTSTNRQDQQDPDPSPSTKKTEIPQVYKNAFKDDELVTE